MGWLPDAPAQQARNARAAPVCRMPLRAARVEGTARRAQPRAAPQACGLIAFESYASMTALPHLLPSHTNNTRRHSPVEGLDYGGPAVIEPRLLRPETLRRHLSVGLPFANPKHCPMSSSDDVLIRRRYISNTELWAKAPDFTLHLASVSVQLLVACRCRLAVLTVRWRTNHPAAVC